MPADPKEVLAALHQARDLIAAGWTQGTYHRSALDGGDCAEGAVEKVTCGGLWTINDLEDNPNAVNRRNAAWAALVEVITANYPDEVSKPAGVFGDPLTRWNDTEGRTHDEVLAIFDKAINQMEETVDA